MDQEQQTNINFRGAVGRALLLPLRAVVYVLNPRNWCNSSDKIRRDIDIALEEVRDGRPKIYLHAEMLQSSTKLGMKMLNVTSGAVVFSVPGYLSGKIYKQSKINKLENKVDKFKEEYPNIKFSLSMRTAIIEIDIEDIQKNSNGKKALIIKKIEKKIYSDLKILMKFIGGDRTPYHDGRLIHSTAKVLYNSRNYIKSEEQELFISDSDSTIICIANKGIMSLGGYKGYNMMQNNDKKAKNSSSEPASSMSSVALNNLCVNKI